MLPLTLYSVKNLICLSVWFAIGSNVSSQSIPGAGRLSEVKGVSCGIMCLTRSQCHVLWESIEVGGAVSCGHDRERQWRPE